MGLLLTILAFLALAAFAFFIACVVVGARNDRARDKAWAEFGRTPPLLVSRDVPPLHATPSTPAGTKRRPGKGARNSGGRP